MVYLSSNNQQKTVSYNAAGQPVQTLQQQPVRVTAGSGNSAQNPIITGANNVLQSIAYHSDYNEAAVDKAKQSYNTDRMAKLYVDTNYLLDAVQSSNRYVDKTNPVTNTLYHVGVGAVNAVSSIPATLYGITQTGKLPGNDAGSKEIINEVIPNIVTQATSKPGDFIPEMIGSLGVGLIAGNAIGGFRRKIGSGGKTGGPAKVPDGYRPVERPSSSSLAAAVRSIDDPDASVMSQAQFTASVKTNANSLNAVPGTVSNVLSKADTALINSINQPALAAARQTARNNIIFSASDATKQALANAPKTVNVRDINTKYQGVSESSQSGLMASIRQPRNARGPSISSSFIHSKPKDITSKAGRTIRTAIESQSVKPALRYSAGPGKREIILQWDDLNQRYMKLRENGDGRYDYFGDLTDKQIAQLEKLDPNGGARVKNREYDILSEGGFLRPQGKSGNAKITMDAVPGKFYVPYKFDYGFNITVENGKYTYTVVDQLFHKGDSFPTRVSDNISSRIIADIESGKDIQLPSAAERFTEWKSNRANNAQVMYLIDPVTADYGLNPFAGYATPKSPIARPKTAFDGMFDGYAQARPQTNTALTATQQRLRAEMEIENSKQFTQLRNGIVSDEVDLPSGLISKGKSYTGGGIEINVKPTIAPIEKDVFKLSNSKAATSGPKGRTGSTIRTETPAAPLVRPRTRSGVQPITNSIPQVSTKVSVKAGIGSVSKAGIAGSVLAIPLMTTTVSGSVKAGQLPLPDIIIPSRPSIAVIDDSLAGSTATTTAADTSLSGAITNTSTTTNPDSTTISSVSPGTIKKTLPIPQDTTGTKATTKKAAAPKSKTDEGKPKTRARPTVKSKPKRKLRVRPRLKLDARRKGTDKTAKKGRKYVQIENYIPWLDDEEDYPTKWYMKDAPKKAGNKTYTAAARKYNSMRKALVKIAKTGKTAKIRQTAARKLKSLYRAVRTAAKQKK